MREVIQDIQEKRVDVARVCNHACDVEVAYAFTF